MVRHGSIRKAGMGVGNETKEVKGNIHTDFAFCKVNGYCFS